tara:strand:+ start:279 stop:425 length:147 start_codon:yes stop_codon:yes gene_type:complete
MPNSKSNPEKTTTEPTKAVVSRVGVNDTPEPTEPKVVQTKNGRTITYN